MRNVYVIWNRGYRTQMVIAVSAQEALQISMDSGHFKRPNNYRKFLDCTEEFRTSDAHPNLEAALNAGRSGVAELIDGVWSIDGKPLTS